MSAVRSGEHRSDPRYAYPKTVEYTITSLDDSDTFKGVVVNISKTGICLYLYAIHAEGETITIKSGLPVQSRTAMVKWIKKVNEGFYKAGLEFIQH